MPALKDSRPLMLSRRFAPLFWTQYFAAFSDNFLKNTLVFVILATMAADAAASMVTLAGAVFMLPFLLFSATGGEIADRFDKAVVARYLKGAEVGVVFLAAFGIGIGSVPVMMAALFLFGTGAALFGPIKYGVLPDYLDRSELPKANAWIEGGTFIAILTGTILAGISFAGGGDNPYVFGALLGVFASIAFLASCLMPRTGSAAPGLAINPNIAASSWHILRDVVTERRLLITSLMVSWFWLCGAIVMSIVPPFVKSIGGDELAIAVCFSVFAVSIGAGSAIAAWLSAGRIVLLQAVVGTVGFGLACLDLSRLIASLPPADMPAGGLAFFLQPFAINLVVTLALAAISGAFLIVPAFAAFQAWARPDARARAVAANNIMNALFTTAGGLIVAGVQGAGASLATVTLGLGLSSLVAGILMFRFLPTKPLRDFLSILFRAFFRLEVKGLENLEKAGPAPILALNHVSYLDAVLALALTENGTLRKPVFAIHAGVAKKWWVRPFLPLVNAVPLDPTKPMGTRTLIRLVEAGNPLVIFPEGRITVTGSLMKVYDGAAMVADKTGAMVVPIKIDGLERTPVSHLSSMQTRRQLFPKVRVTINPPERLAVPPAIVGRKRRMAAGAQLYGIMSNLVFSTSGKTGTVFEEIVRAAADFGTGRVAVEDPLSGPLTYGGLLTGARALGRELLSRLPGHEAVGVLLPNSNAVAVTWLALLSAGKVPAMLNFSAGVLNIRAACAAAEVRGIVTSRAFVERARLGAAVEALEAEGVGFLWLEDIRPQIGPWRKVLARLNRSRPLIRRRAGDRATILFTSGSEGTPKGVVLTHANILANAAQAAARVDFHKGDKVFNVLPAFHSFGLTAGTVLPLVYGVPVYFYPSPLHYRIIPEVIYGSNATIIFGTDTFLAGYARTAHPYDFRSVRYCFAGAEPVKASTRTTYMDKFGLRILEGYGVTEAAPVIALNTPMYSKPGSVGKLMPGIEARLEPVEGVAEGGRLFIRGPNIMAGYLRAENPGVLEPPADGWHDTGDIVSIDEDGFVTILGRAKRFAKIGGEMVSLAAVEALAAELWPGVPLAVTALSDARKGERLVLVVESAGASRGDLLAFARRKGVNELAVPAEVMTGAIPLLGSGKPDYGALKALVERGRPETSA
ncbi:MAG: acyl-[ACP]--phospholipid O-acyltransferase [Pseudochelatococcus sp.]|uniref:acyl-[ACP]--phospholipid O-acyltransferase n=1 Tax=Pseudochelatococcus sp. TaxID=2020869 RepID=UPI003D8D7902